MQPDEPGAILMLVDESRTFIDQNTHDWLVLHKTASGGSAQDIATFFANDPAMASTHYIVGQDGTIVQAVLEKDGAGGNCCLETGHATYLPLGVNLNVKTVSIEHVDPASDNSTPLTDAQKAASFKLVYDICQRHNIHMGPGDALGGIIGHHDIAPLTRARCPGNYPMDELFTYLQNGGEPDMSITIQTPGVSSYFKELNANQWQRLSANSSGGYPIIQYGILNAYKSYGNFGLCGLTDWGLPNSNEMLIEKYWPAYAHLAGKGIVVQYYERCCVIYDPQHLYSNPPGSGPVYKLAVYESPSPGADPLIAQLQAKLAQQPVPAQPLVDALTQLKALNAQREALQTQEATILAKV